MSRTACKFISLLTVCALLLCCITGCGGSGHEINQTAEKYRRLFEKGILIKNNLSLRIIQAEAPEGCSAKYFEIDGLENKEIQKKINRRIESLSEKMCRMEFLPSYRGISLKMKQYGSMKRAYHVYFFPVFNSNNILSVSASCYVWFSAEDNSNDFVYSYDMPMTFDLSTGEELTLRDLFKPEANYMELINREIDRCLLTAGFDGEQTEYGEHCDLITVAPFKGIKPQQKFLLSEDGDIRLYFDYETPEFYTAYCSCLLTLDSGNLGSAFTNYRVAGESLSDLYSNKKTDCFFVSDFGNNSNERIDNSGSQNTFYLRYKYLDNTPDAVLRQVESITYDEKQIPISVNKIKSRAAKKLGKKKKNITLSRTVYTYPSNARTSGYYSFTRHADYTAGSDDAWTAANPDPEYLTVVYNTAYCFDRDGNTVALDSLFNDPEKVDELLIRAIPENVKRSVNESSSGISLTDEQLASLTEQLLPNIDGFALGQESFTFSYDLSDDELSNFIMKTLGLNEQDYSVKLGFCGAAYRDIGCENLSFFNEVFE